MSGNATLVGLAAALALVAFGAMAPVASAEDPASGTVLAGRGTLRAHGNGIAAVKGTMEYHATAGEAAVLLCWTAEMTPGCT